MLGRWLMMAVQGVAIGPVATASANNSATLSIARPAGVGTGALLVAFIVGSSNTLGAVTPPAGWTKVRDSDGRSVHVREVADGEAASYSWTFPSSTKSRGFIVALANGRYDAVGAMGAEANPAVAPSVTAASATSIALVFFSENEVANLSYSTPAGWSAVAADNDATAPSAAVFGKAVGAGATGDVSSTSTPTSTSRGVQIVVRPR